jgi:hypothetical protein
VQVSFNVNIGVRSPDGRRGVTIWAYPYAHGVICEGKILFNDYVNLPELESFQSTQGWLQTSLVALCGALQEDVKEAGYTAPVDLMLNAVKRKQSLVTPLLPTPPRAGNNRPARQMSYCRAGLLIGLTPH